MRTLVLERIARILRAANARPYCREKFYPIKSAILHAYGTKSGIDVQRIQQRCHGSYRYPCDDDCSRCDGTGIYATKYFELQRWNLAGHEFHEPIRRLTWGEARDREISIDGKVTHRACQRSYVACAAIGRIFDCEYYWFVLRNSERSRFCRYVRRVEQIAYWVVSPPLFPSYSADGYMRCVPMFALPVPLEVPL